MIKHKLLLASQSPRRKELLGMIVDTFETANPIDIVENYPDDITVENIPEYLSKLKADAYTMQLKENEILITADTVVICDGELLGKPHSRLQAIKMLEQLSGRTHTVVTGVTLTSINKSDSFTESTDVTFDSLTEEEIVWYVDTYNPFDKAGAYGIQEWIGGIGITGIRGCFYNVMGLPLHHLYKSLMKF